VRDGRAPPSEIALRPVSSQLSPLEPRPSFPSNLSSPLNRVLSLPRRVEQRPNWRLPLSRLGISGTRPSPDLPCTS